VGNDHEHTPGPWRATHTRSIETMNGELIATVPRFCNRRLIAAAPDLLEALKEIVEQKKYESFGDGVSRSVYVMAVAQNAIAKAEGKP
jgi:hypothetical protein